VTYVTGNHDEFRRYTDMMSGNVRLVDEASTTATGAAPYARRRMTWSRAITAGPRPGDIGGFLLEECIFNWLRHATGTAIFVRLGAPRQAGGELHR
jgi:hypothetical protein